MMDTKIKKLKIMKTYTFNIWFFLALSLFMGSCEEEEIITLDSGASTTMIISSNEVVLEKENEGTDALTISWTKPDYGYNAAANYQILFDLPGGDFSTAQVVEGGKEYNKTFKTEELNEIMLDLGLLAEESAQVIVKVKSTLSSESIINSEVSPMMVTPYSDVFTSIYMIGDALLGWDTSLAVETYGVGPKTYEVIAEFNNGKIFRFFDQPSWDAEQYNWNSFDGGIVDDKLESAEDGDSNFKFIGETGFYRINISLINKTITMTPTDQPELYMVGAAVPEAGWGWDTPINMIWVRDGVFEASTQFENEAFRFFTGFGDWGSGLNYIYFLEEGYVIDSNFEDAEDDDNNFKFIGTPGIYKITVNKLNKTITIE